MAHLKPRTAVHGLPPKPVEPAKYILKPLHLLYMMAMYVGDFDERLHAGHYSQKVYAERIEELLDMGLIEYHGIHTLTKKGTSHIRLLLSEVVHAGQ